VDLVDHEQLVADADAVDHELDHPGELVVHDECAQSKVTPDSIIPAP